ncbi:MAG TPA: CHAP domain-containing protein [Nocardioides sp.]|nr:CHAP domain-containing protein [Nocardioides sp.]
MILGGLALSVVGLLPTTPRAHAAGDDYPYRGLGQCPLVPLPPVKPGPQPGRPGGPATPGAPTHPGPPAHPAAPASPGAPGSPAPTEPGGPTKPPVPRQCAKHLWFYNGSYGDPWGFALRNCTSFVAWRLRTTNGLDAFENHFGGVHWGNADQWDGAASALGYLVDDMPAVGAVAQTDDGRVGHVAWVSAVGDGTVTVEEYNLAVAGGYDVRTVPTSDFRYLHLADVAPAPYLGSTRAGLATADAHGSAWTARTTANGALLVRRPTGQVGHLRAPGGWSPHAAPTVTTDHQGRVWVAAVTTAGRVLAAHTASGAPRLGPMRPLRAVSATTSSPVLAPAADGVRLLTVTPAGDLLERHTLGPAARHWSRPHRLGLPGSWSTHAAPSTATDPHGRLWLAAVTRRGVLQAQHAVGEHRWSGFHPVDHRTWSVTSSPALAAGGDGRVWLASVDATGSLSVRHTGTSGGHWFPGRTVAGTWSPYASPALAVDRGGRTWLGAVGADGRVAVRSAAPGTERWRPARGLPRVPASLTGSPALTTAPDGSVLVGVTDGAGHAVWRRPVGPTTLLPVAHGPHGGGFTVSRFL